jgi:hypothetical protein
VSSSVTLAANTVTVHVSPPTKFAVGSSVKVPGPPDSVAGWLPLVAQLIENQPPVTSTGSVKVIVRFAHDGTPVPLEAGNVDATRGAESCAARGFGAPMTKSAALLSVSVAPSPLRRAAVVLLVAAVGPAPSKQFAAGP